MLNNLFKHTALQLAFNANMLALVDGQPQTLPLKAILQHHIDWRREVVRRRTEFDLGKARDRAHILEGLKIALDNLDAVIKTIRESADVETARANLIAGFALTEIQANAILEMQLRRLAALERKKIEDEYLAVIQLIAELEDILANPRGSWASSATSSASSSRKYAGERRTRIADDANRELSDEDLIADEDVVITVSGPRLHQAPAAGHLPPPGARRQGHHRRPDGRGGRGRPPARRQHPRLGALLHQPRPRLQLQGPPRPDASRTAKGIPIINLEGVQVESGERVLAVITIPNFEKGHNLVMATRKGVIKKTPIEQFERVRSTGIRAITVAEDDDLAWVAVSSGDDDVVLATAQGKIARFNETEVRPMGRDAAGVIGIRLARKGDRVVGMSVVEPDADLLVLTETGYGKRVALTEFRRMHRGSQGVRLIALEGRKTGPRGRRRAGHRAGRGAAAHQRQRPGRAHRRQERQSLRQPARGVIVMRLNEGDEVAGIAVFRAGLAEQRSMGDNDDLRDGIRSGEGLTRAGGRRVTTHEAAMRPPATTPFGRRDGSARPGPGRIRPVQRQRQPRPGAQDRRVPRHAARAVRGVRVRQREHLRQDPGQRPRARRLPHPADLLARSRSRSWSC